VFCGSLLEQIVGKDLPLVWIPIRENQHSAVVGRLRDGLVGPIQAGADHAVVDEHAMEVIVAATTEEQAVG